MRRQAVYYWHLNVKFMTPTLSLPYGNCTASVCRFYGVHAYTSYREVDLELVIAMVCSGLCLIGLDLLYFLALGFVFNKLFSCTFQKCSQGELHLTKFHLLLVYIHFQCWPGTSAIFTLRTPLWIYKQSRSPLFSIVQNTLQ